MRKSVLLFCFATAITAHAQTPAQTPSRPIAGTVLNRDGNVISVPGVLGNLLPGVAVPLAIGPIRSAAFTSQLGAIKTDTEMLTVDGAGAILSRTAEPPGAAMWGFAADGSLQWMHVAGSPRIGSLTGGAQIDTAPLGDELIGLGVAGSGGLPVLVRTGAQLWAEIIDPATGAVLQQTPISGSAPAIAFEGGWLASNSNGLLWTGSGAQVARFIASPAPVSSLQTAGPHAVAVNGAWLLNGTWSLLEIPSLVITHPRAGIAPPQKDHQ